MRPQKPVSNRAHLRDLAQQARAIRETSKRIRNEQQRSNLNYRDQLIAHVAETLASGSHSSRIAKSGISELGIDYEAITYGVSWLPEDQEKKLRNAGIAEAAKLAYEIGQLGQRLTEIKADILAAAHNEPRLIELIAVNTTIRPTKEIQL
jgi:hypothetical protein